ncbi:MAG: penicillin acylase family protein [Pirellulales bacterium]|nr:penicillin acylase family protein [Pirellulales bacterium]
MKCVAAKIALVWMVVMFPLTSLAAEPPAVQASSSKAIDLGTSREHQLASAEQLAESVTILRDSYGTPHIDGATDAATLFGLAYAQAEDNFWQVEDNYILSLGRYSEVHGPTGMNSDFLNRAFEIVPRSREDFAHCDPADRRLTEAFISGLNYYLAKHPQVKPRLIQRFEPWHLLAFSRHLTLEMCFRYTRLDRNFLPRVNPRIWAASGSNAWAIAPQKTRDGKALLLVNPHLPQFGFTQLYEAHLRSGEGLNVAGAMFFGNPLPSLGHNDSLGWALTTNEPDIADLWRLTFDDRLRPLRYRYDNATRDATQWTETIGVLGSQGVVPKRYAFRKTHYGPVVAQEDDAHYLAARVADLFELRPLRQTLRMAKARNVAEFRRAMSMLQIPFMNVLCADREGSVFYLYGGSIPRRDPSFDWTNPVDGSNPRTAWSGFHSFDELPQLLNPQAGYLQNCNSSPFTTTHLDNPDRRRFPDYMFEDADDDKLRAKRSRELLQARDDWTLELLEQTAFDTTLYWAIHEMPKFMAAMETVNICNPQLAGRALPLVDRLERWDGKITSDSTAATLCTAWYERLYGAEYPGEQLLPEFVDKPVAQIEALVAAADSLSQKFGDWQVRWGDAHRVQRHPRMINLFPLPFSDAEPSLPCVGGHGPMGIIFTQYYSPVLNVPFVETQKKHYALVGATYLAAYEFGDRFRGGTLVNFGASADPDSPHYFDQAELMAAGKFKPEVFHWDEVLASARQCYHPGQ